jgi:hypothetical protein
VTSLSELGLVEGQTVYDSSGEPATVVSLRSEGPGKSPAVVISYEDGTTLRKTRSKLSTDSELEGEVSREEILEQEIRELRGGGRRSRQADVHVERVALAIERNTRAVPPIAVRPSHDDHGHPHTHELVLSDLHYGEHVDPEQVNGLNEYTPEICARRLSEVIESLVSFKDNRPYPINKLVISALGDNCSGGPGIHDEIRENNLVTISEQAHDIGLLLGETVETLAEYYPEIELVGVSGNHPRMARPHASKNVFDNFDWIGYKTTEVYLRHLDQVTVIAPKAAMAVHNIAGNDVLLWHGDGVRSSMPGVPWGGVMRRWNELKRQYLSQGTNLASVRVGHFHSAGVVLGGEVIMNGSLIGLNEYGLKNFGSGQAPTQLLITHDEVNHRMTDVSYITPA